MQRVKKYLLVITLLIIGLTVTHADAAEASYKKHVSVVFDDSGSMASDVRWAHANYALQTLVSVLDQGDILDIHYMNASNNDISIELGDETAITEVLGLIRSKSIPDSDGAGDTPIESISVGLSNLENDSAFMKEGVNYDKWLVLITDGDEMTDAKGQSYVNYKADSSFESGYKWVGILDRKIAGMLSASSADFSTVILKIGDTTQDMMLNSSMIGAPLIYKSASVSKDLIQEKQIIENMNDIASLISGRLPIDIADISGKTMRVRSQVPFDNFEVLLQNSDAEVVQVLDSDGTGIDTTVGYTGLLAPDASVVGTGALETDSNLYGSAIRIAAEGEEALASGEYIIVFDSGVEGAKVTSFCYPNIEFIFKYYVNGIEVDLVYQEDMISLEFIPVRGGTEEVLDSLPDNINYTLEMKCGDQYITFKEDSFWTNEFIIKDDAIIGSLTAQIPDVWLWTLNVSETIDVAPLEEKPSERVFELQPSNENTSVAFRDYETAPVVYLTPYLNGERLTSEEMEKAELTVMRIYDGNGSLTDVDYELYREGSAFTFKPVYKGFRPTLPAESYKVEFRFEANALEGADEYAFAEIIYTFEDASFFVRYLKYISFVLLLVLAVVYVIGLIMKPKIREKGYEICVSRYDNIIDLDDPVSEERVQFKVNTLSRFLIPFARERGTAVFDFKAGSKGEYIYLMKSSQHPGMSIGSFVLKAGNAGQRDLRLNLEQKLEIIEEDKLTVYRYMRKKTDN